MSATIKGIDPKTYPEALWGTQGGGLARQVGTGNHYVFVEAPGHSGLNVGDAVPGDWDIQPANQLAREQMPGF